MKASKIQVNEQKVLFAASFPDMPVKTLFYCQGEMLLCRERCCYV